MTAGCGTFGAGSACGCCQVTEEKSAVPCSTMQVGLASWTALAGKKGGMGGFQTSGELMASLRQPVLIWRALPVAGCHHPSLPAAV